MGKVNPKTTTKVQFAGARRVSCFQYLGLDFPMFSRRRRHVSDCFWRHVINCTNLFAKSQKTMKISFYICKYINVRFLETWIISDLSDRLEKFK